MEADLTKITWTHAVNNASFLESVLKDNNVEFIEADVVVGTLTNDPDAEEQPIMAHPPSSTSDLSLEQFLSTIYGFLQQPNATFKGVKLDFKSIQVFQESLEILTSIVDKQIVFPLWLNADILPGPIDSVTKPVDAEKFLIASEKFPLSRIKLSVGWTTLYGGSLTYGSYSDHHIEGMITTLRKYNVRHSVTFPVRAGLAANSLTQMTNLLSRTADLDSTLTVWSSEGDHVDVSALRDVILTCGLNKTYVDVPKELYDQLHLHQV